MMVLDECLEPSSSYEDTKKSCDLTSLGRKILLRKNKKLKKMGCSRTYLVSYKERVWEFDKDARKESFKNLCRNFCIGKDQTKNNLIVGFTEERKKKSFFVAFD